MPNNQLDILQKEFMGGRAEVLPAYKDALANLQDALVEPDNTTRYNERRKWMLDQISLMPKYIKILDVGSWTGGFAAELYKNGYKNITCLEIRKDAVDKGKQVFPFLRWIQADIEDYIFKEKYDFIILGEVLEHLANPVLALEKLRDALSWHGRIFFTVPTEDTVFQGGTAPEHISEVTSIMLESFHANFATLAFPQAPNYKWYAGIIFPIPKNKRIAIYDLVGLRYDGNTLLTRGLGGSESAVIYISRELAQIGFDVTVFNKTENEGIYDGVRYLSIDRAEFNDEDYDIMISSRSCLPFTPDHLEGLIWEQWNYKVAWARKLKDRSKKKVLWLHDTFCSGDNWVEAYALDGYIDEIFTLSDWHSNYIMNGHSWRGRYFEVLKRKVWQTRNGLQPYLDTVDIAKKDKNLFVYNSSVTKGMIPLLEIIWEKIREKIPNAKLKIIGGYYRGANSNGPDEQENKWHELYEKYNGKNGVEFTGIITQKEIAEILSQASLMIYPSAFPETYGISTLESIYYNTPVVTCRHGALEEVASEKTCYLIDYDINKFPQQIDRFVDAFLQAYNDDYLRQQKMYACNEFKPWVTWEQVALQWKQHFYNLFNLPLSISELSIVRKINNKIQQLFGRRFLNKEDVFNNFYKEEKQKPILVVTPVYNAEKFIDKTINSVVAQMYDNYKMVIINDFSSDKTEEIIKKTVENLPEEIKTKIRIHNNDERKGALANQVLAIDTYADQGSIIVLLDGDDWLVNDPDIFSFINKEYLEEAKFTYGSCYSLADNINLIAQPYPDEVHKNKSYRSHLFNWGMPYTHLRTFALDIFKKVDRSNFKDEDGKYYFAGGDNALFYPLIEQCESKQIKCIQRILYVYNDTNPLNDYKINGMEQNRNARRIRGEIMEKKILIAMPTAKYIESETFMSIYNLEKPNNCKVDFQCFYGYNVAQVRNLIAHYAQVNNYDYVFWVDSDIILPKDSLIKLLTHNKDVISGIYIQRNENIKVPEIYMPNHTGGMSNIYIDNIIEDKLLQVAGCGFGCVLTKVKVLKDVGYPQFEYHNAIDHRDTVSEDIDFCIKVLAKGFSIYADTSIKCPHIGNIKFNV